MYTDKTSQLPLAGVHHSPPSRLWWSRYKALLVLLPGFYFLLTYHQVPLISTKGTTSFCPEVAKINPLDVIYSQETLQMLLHNQTFKLESAKRLAAAIQVPTEVHDDMLNPNTTDSYDDLYKLEPAWKNFEFFHSFLEETYPLVHKHLKVEKVNKFSLVFTWQGSDSTKKPLMLTAHQDVVPVQKETIPQWDYPPFEGVIANGSVHGRGASDCKNLLTGLMDTIELLLAEGQFSPERTVILAFGYDEESEGTGAVAISEFLLERYGKDSMYQIIDEGGSGFTEQNGVNFILPATAEKGHLDNIIELYTPGGHSSVPPPHTSIGIISELVSLVEKTPFDSIITPRNPVLGMLQCVAEHSDIDKSMKSTILKAHVDKKANKNLLKYLSKEIRTKYLVTTSQATDIISGGAKANALPEHAQVLINSRVAVEESIKSTSDKILGNVLSIAHRFDLGVYFEGEQLLAPTENGYFNYTLFSPLEPAPVTPMYSDVWNTFGGSLRFLYEDLVFPQDDKKFVFAPYLSTGNTDTKCYWDLTANIFRYMPGFPGPDRHVHSVSEFVPIESHSLIVAFYYYYIQLVDKK
ncbi:glutamate carboxypeptidase [Yamadazyma tenuis]|uniref:Peptidase M20 dimerisation domain-containing protein n=1 Tax=Candida tenuis (strain ATCC 10573 / BCRC 21748 / CBS 615 / JCM 9827 / NBRC 10315 / NRRL Y-1498 / VKM Y-70) TaxID=590646 RepID=G3B6C8_CANTC|nr:uncharacterized protein CANTEDRAFT_106436 [Yamadazyma tenuis ATCC 10573]EGV63435.1 hypothetical protein CANTEDRAFT_106436 [Yamadazyma tenuis ATCC 10573]WEJ96740.1 glutamate carboxypeptidase [Yamadazyma tenuis]